MTLVITYAVPAFVYAPSKRHTNEKVENELCVIAGYQFSLLDLLNVGLVSMIT